MENENRNNNKKIDAMRDTLKKIIDANGSCFSVSALDCGVCPLNNIKNEDGRVLCCWDYVFGDIDESEVSPSHANKLYLDAAIRKLIDLDIEDFLEN